jgi:DNA-binding CsgD family transcriptional regulator
VTGYSAEPGRALTPRMRQMLELVAGGASVDVAAAALGIAPSTGRHTLEGARARLGSRSTAGAIVVAMRRGELTA